VVYVPEKYKHLVDAQRGSRVDGFVSFVDLAPTLFSLAGVERPGGLDGKAFLGKDVDMDEVNQRDQTYGYADRFDEKYDMVRSLRKGKYKYIRSYQPFNYDGLMNNYRYRQLGYQQWLDLYKEGALNPVQSAFFEARPPELLFDVEADPFETKNLAGDPEYGDILKKLRDKLIGWEKLMPDLSFYPEHHLIQKAFENPVQFGQDHQEDIARYLDIANLSLQPYEEVKSAIQIALADKDPWQRYWALIVCSTFGNEAAEMKSQIEKLASADSELMNRVRAAEFLGLTRMGDPVESMQNALYECQDDTEALLILNSIVLMQDLHHNYSFDIKLEKITESVRNSPQVKRRLEYIQG
jgi:hypothetical protein